MEPSLSLTLVRSFLSDLGPALRRHAFGPRFPALTAKLLHGGALASAGWRLEFLASGDLHDADGVADHIGGALPAFRSDWRQTSLDAMSPNTLSSSAICFSFSAMRSLVSSTHV